MANLFIGFPVPRAKIADMIEGAAPPLEHVSNHLPPGSDPLILSTDIEDNEIVKWTGEKFIGAAAPGAGVVLSPISINACHFMPGLDSYDWNISDGVLTNRASLDVAYYWGSVFFPHGAVVTKMTLYGYRNDVSSTLGIYIKRLSNTGIK